MFLFSSLRSSAPLCLSTAHRAAIVALDSLVYLRIQAKYIFFLLSKGIFKIEDSAHVARLWGIRKNRPAMNYDKLSRSIRQYYKKGIIRKPDVSRRLVYQFVNPV